MEHTPGPWNYGISADKPPHYYIHCGPEMRLQWHMDNMPGGTIQLTEANARLIAAAPDLLEACQELYRVFMEPDSQGFINGMVLHRLAFERMHVAVTKATGGTNDA